MSGPGRAPEANLEDLEQLARRDRSRLAQYRRRVYLGRGEPRRLAELERELQGSESRLRLARLAAGASGDGAVTD